MEVALRAPMPLAEAPFPLAVHKWALILHRSQPDTQEAETAAPQSMSVSWGGPQWEGFWTESQYVALCSLPSISDTVGNKATVCLCSTFIFTSHFHIHSFVMLRRVTCSMYY